MDFLVFYWFQPKPQTLGPGTKHLLGGLLGEKDGVDVGEDTAGGDGDSAEELVELLIVLDGKGDVPGDDAGLLVVAGGVSGELEDLGAEVLEDGGEVDTGADSDPGGVSALLQVPADTGDGELKSGLGGGANALSASASSLSLSFSFSCGQQRRGGGMGSGVSAELVSLRLE
jgi:hypothetical protein